jgi:hypothetical protein
MEDLPLLQQLSFLMAPLELWDVAEVEAEV